MKWLLLAIIVILVIMWVYFGMTSKICNCPSCATVASPAAEYLINGKSSERFSTAQLLSGMAYGYNQPNVAGSYAGAMNDLNELETMNLANVQTDLISTS
jgi:hypothetical protein